MPQAGCTPSPVESRTPTQAGEAPLQSEPVSLLNCDDGNLATMKLNSFDVSAFKVVGWRSFQAQSDSATPIRHEALADLDVTVAVGGKAETVADSAVRAVIWEALSGLRVDGFASTGSVAAALDAEFIMEGPGRFVLVESRVEVEAGITLTCAGGQVREAAVSGFAEGSLPDHKSGSKTSVAECGVVTEAMSEELATIVARC
jgi:hypothetical protein